MRPQLQDDIMPLVLTPSPHRGECLKGFILRVSELNGYTTPTIMLSTAGMSANEMNSITPPLGKLAPLFCTTVSELKKLSYRKPSGMLSAKHVLIKHLQIPTYYLCIKNPKICTECILDKGYIESYWDLRHVIACPTHQRLLLKTCPNCNKQLSWMRPGLLKCKCEFDLSHVKGARINNQSVIGLLAFMKNQFTGKSHDYKLLQNKLGFPVDHLRKLTLQELLSIIVKLENAAANVTSVQTASHDEMILSKASNALQNWPDGFHSYLHSFNPEGTSTEGFGLRKQFESFCGSLFKTAIPKEKISFIKEAFTQFGNQQWKRGYVQSKGPIRQQIVGIYGLSSAIGVMPSTTKKLVMKGLVKGKTSHLNGQTRHFFDISQGLPFKIAKGDSFTIRKAAAFLGIPVSVLKLLREQGVYEALHIANPIAVYHEQDLLIFRNRMRAECKPIQLLQKHIHIELKQIMNMKTGSPQVKADFIKTFLMKDGLLIQSFIHHDAQIYFIKEEVSKFIDAHKTKYFGLRTVVNAAKQLNCDPLVVKSLCQTGSLETVTKPTGVYVKEDSLENFNANYVSCAKIASQYRTSSSKILCQCENKNIEVVWFDKFGNNKKQPFLKRQTANLYWQF